jgi:hypothetical protein
MAIIRTVDVECDECLAWVVGHGTIDGEEPSLVRALERAAAAGWAFVGGRALCPDCGGHLAADWVAPTDDELPPATGPVRLSSA